MKNQKHTPGPWHMIDEAGLTYIVNDNDDTVAAIPVDRDDDGTEISDARLIAAAPEMLEALIKFRKQLPVIPAPDGWTPQWSRDLDALIAKATGGGK